MLQDMHEASDRCKLMFHVPTRGLVGYKGVFTTMTKGEGLINRAFLVCCLAPSEGARMALHNFDLLLDCP